VVASSRRAQQEADYLRGLGADEIINARELSGPGVPLDKERWAGAVDSLGSRTLANVLSQTQYDGAVATCGLAQGADLPASVLPVILRDVTLAGVNSVLTPREKREEAWGRLATDLDLAKLDSMTSRARLDDVPSPGVAQLRSIAALLGNDPSPQWLSWEARFCSENALGRGFPMTNVKKRSAAQADLFSGLKRLKENVEHLGSALGDTAKRKKLNTMIIGGDDHWR
jgi:hypothetical protein